MKVPTAMADVPSLLSSQVMGSMPGIESQNSDCDRSFETVVVAVGSDVVVVVVVGTVVLVVEGGIFRDGADAG